PHVDFGLKVLGGDLMSIPGLYRLVQNVIKKEAAKLYMWPQTLEIPILDSSLGIVKKPVGVLHVKVVRAIKLMKMDILGLSDPYVKLKLSGDMLPSKKTTIKKNTLNPVWNETFKLVVRDPQAQTLQVNVYDWDKVGSHDRLGMQVVPLKLLTPYETMELSLDLLKNITEPLKKHPRGQVMLELTYAPFKDENDVSSGPPTPVKNVSGVMSFGEAPSGTGSGVLLVTVQGAEDVEEFQFLLEEPPIHEKIHIQIKSRRTRMSFLSRESLGHVDINLVDVVNNGRINHKFHLIDSKNGMVHVELRWRET
nr:synaptotagmin-3 isoform X2 [Tanacetum cinerariifolium]GEV32064.1 synaptotagmin-3 isoform X2 [Tanacetum cinerariifolium]